MTDTPAAPVTPLDGTPLDLRGLKCPLPALRTRKALTALPSGTRLIVTCNDPLAAIDIPNLVRETGDHLEEQARVAEAGGEVLVFHIRRQAR